MQTVRELIDAALEAKPYVSLDQFDTKDVSFTDFAELISRTADNLKSDYSLMKIAEGLAEENEKWEEDKNAKIRRVKFRSVQLIMYSLMLLGEDPHEQFEKYYKKFTEDLLSIPL